MATSHPETASMPAAPRRRIPRPRIPRPRIAQSETPFLPLGQAARIALLYYLVAYRLIFPILTAYSTGGSKDLLGLRIAVEVFNTIMLAYPFIFYRKEYGWLHPLVLPTLFSLAKAMMKNPLALVMPFHASVVDFIVETPSPAAVLSISNMELAWARLELSLVLGLAQATYLIFFLVGPTFTLPRIKIYRPPNIAIYALIFIAGLMSMAAIFIIAKGGLSEVLIAMRGGRRELFQGMGHFVAAATMAPMIAIIWFAHEKRPFSNPLFIAGLVAALLTSLLASGSRSSMILPVLTLVLIWWRRKGRALIVPTLFAGIFGLFVIGAFGSIRQDHASTTIDLSVLDPTNVGSTLNGALTDIEDREQKEPTLAVLVGANQKGLLWGKSYLNAAGFWVPRALWKQKPSGTDVYNMWINFNGNPIDSKPPQIGTWGIPVGAEMESYWNFGAVGVALLFALLGMFHATLAKAAHVYRDVPLFWVFYITAILTMSGTAKELIGLIESTGVLVVFALFAGILRFKGNTGDLVAIPLGPSR